MGPGQRHGVMVLVAPPQLSYRYYCYHQQPDWFIQKYRNRPLGQVYNSVPQEDDPGVT